MVYATGFQLRFARGPTSNVFALVSFMANKYSL